MLLFGKMEERKSFEERVLDLPKSARVDKGRRSTLRTAFELSQDLFQTGW